MHGLAPFAAIAAGKLTGTGYAQLLRSLFQFHTAIAAAAEQSGWSPFSSSSQRLHYLAADLDHLRASPPLAPKPMLAAGSAQRALGVIYVAEGSMMGGRLIAAQLDYLLGSGKEGRRFFTGRGQHDSLGWRRLVQLIEEQLGPAQALNAAVSGATAAFELFECLVRQTSGTSSPPADQVYSPGLTRNCSMRPVTGS